MAATAATVNNSAVNNRFMFPPSGIAGPPGWRKGGARWRCGVSALDHSQRLAQTIDHRVDMLPLRDQRRSDDHAVPGRLDVQAVVEELLLQRVTALARRTSGVYVDRRQQAVATNIGDDGHVLERPERVQKIRRQRGASLEQSLVPVDIQRRE